MTILIKVQRLIALASFRICIIFLLCLTSASVFALQGITVNQKQSKVSFAGEHVGMKFKGVFEKWEAQLVLPALTESTTAPTDSSIEASFDLASAKTGDFTYDSTLPEGDWFDVKNHPLGSFVSNTIEVVDGAYHVTGELTLRGISKPQAFVLKKNGDRLQTEFIINRLDYYIGFDSDPDAEWVSKDISMTLDLKIP